MRPTPNRHSKRHSFALITAICGSVAVHALGVLYLQGLGINVYLPRHDALIESTHVPSYSDHPNTDQEKEDRERELAIIFNQLADRPTPPQHLPINLPFLGVEGGFHTPELDSSVMRMSPIGSGAEETDQEEVAPSHAFDKLTLKEQVVLVNRTEVLAKIEVQSLQTDDASIQELVQATEQAKGFVKEEVLARIEAEGLKVGLDPHASLEAMAKENRPSTGHAEAQSAEGRVDINAIVGRNNEALTTWVDTVLNTPAVSGKQAAAGTRLTVPAEEVAGVAYGIDQIGTLATSQDFTIELAYTPKSSGSGYTFRLAFLPKDGITFKRIRQNLFFLIDRSHSISKDRYLVTCAAVIKALPAMHPADTFNILVFDDGVIRFSDTNVAVTKENIAKANEFITNQSFGGLFASTDLYASLHKIVPEVVADTEVNTAILISDGDSYLKREKQRLMIGRWTRQNHGKVSLYSVATGSGNNLPLLELLSAFNKGLLVYTPSYTGLEGAMSTLMRALRTPIGKDVVATAVSSDAGANIILYPKEHRLPTFYEDTPYVIYGECDRLADFTLFLQGRHYDKWLDIKHSVTFDGATLGDGAIERRCILFEADDHYERYLRDGQLSHLENAKELLGPLRIQPAFQ